MLLSSISVSFLAAYILYISGLQVIHFLITPLPRDKRPWRITGTAKRKQKKRISRLDRNILSYLKKGGYLLSRFAGSTIGVSGLNFSVRNGKRWDTAAIATIISELGIHAAQHYIGKRRIIPLTSNQQNIKKQTGMYMKKHPCEKKYRVPDKSFRAISSARLWRRRLYTCTLSTSSSMTTLIKEI